MLLSILEFGFLLILVRNKFYREEDQRLQPRSSPRNYQPKGSDQIFVPSTWRMEATRLFSPPLSHPPLPHPAEYNLRSRHQLMTNLFIQNTIKSQEITERWNENCGILVTRRKIIVTKKEKLWHPLLYHSLLDPALQGQAIKQLMTIILSTTAWLGTSQPVSICPRMKDRWMSWNREHWRSQVQRKTSFAFYPPSTQCKTSITSCSK